MQILSPTYEVHVDDDRGELMFKTSGLFDAQSMNDFLTEVSEKVRPILLQNRKMRALGDLTDFVTQTRAIGETMAETLVNAEKLGIERIAIVIQSKILRMQYKRISKGRCVEIFENQPDALTWLRTD